MDYDDRSLDGIDSKESARDFLQAIEDFTTRKAQEAAAIRNRLGAPDGLQKNQTKQSLTEGQSRLHLQLAP